MVDYTRLKQFARAELRRPRFYGFIATIIIVCCGISVIFIIARKWDKYECYPTEYYVAESEFAEHYTWKYKYCVSGSEVCNTKRFNKKDHESNSKDESLQLFEQTYPMDVVIDCYRNTNFNTKLRVDVPTYASEWAASIVFGIIFICIAYFIYVSVDYEIDGIFPSTV